MTQRSTDTPAHSTSNQGSERILDTGLSDNQAQSGLVQDGLRARHFKTSRTVLALVLREMSTTYGRSPGGYLWAVLEPIAAITILSIGFSLMFRSPSLGTNFPLFFATGYLPFGIYTSVVRNTGLSIRFSRALLAYPAVTYADTIIARFLLAATTQILVAAIVLFGVHIVYDIRSIIDFPSLILACSLAAVLGLGIGTLNCYLLALYPIWDKIWGIVTRPLFLISGVFFTYEAMPDQLRTALWYNPILQIVGLARKGVYASYDAQYVSVPYILGIAMICGFFGFLLLYRHNRTVLNS